MLSDLLFEGNCTQCAIAAAGYWVASSRHGPAVAPTWSFETLISYDSPKMSWLSHQNSSSLNLHGMGEFKYFTVNPTSFMKFHAPQLSWKAELDIPPPAPLGPSAELATVAGLAAALAGSLRAAGSDLDDSTERQATGKIPCFVKIVKIH